MALASQGDHSVCRLVLLLGGFVLFFLAFFTVHVVVKVGAQMSVSSSRCCRFVTCCI